MAAAFKDGRQVASGFLYSKADHETYLFDYGHFFGDAYKKHASQNESEMPHSLQKLS